MEAEIAPRSEISEVVYAERETDHIQTDRNRYRDAGYPDVLSKEYDRMECEENERCQRDQRTEVLKVRHYGACRMPRLPIVLSGKLEKHGEAKQGTACQRHGSE